jgi:DNA-binding CsgD family transcriptional regulator
MEWGDLTERQQQLAKGLETGLTTREIAREMGRDERTIGNLVAWLYRQVGAQDRRSFVAWMEAHKPPHV